MPERAVARSVDVTICIATFRRRELLRRLLVGLSQIRFKRIVPPRVTVVVVDNDAEQTGKEVVDSIELPWPMRYVAEPRRGIAVVRNRAIRESYESEFIAFLDDDETPSPEWLDELIFTQQKFDADVVAGPVFADFALDVPRWIAEGDFFKRVTHGTGHRMDKCSSNNVLFRKVIVNQIGFFNEGFELTGADDTEFFLRVQKAGFAIVWANDAAVYEDISTSRANISWLLRRAYRLGNSWSLCERSVYGNSKTTAIRFGKGLVRILQGILSATSGLLCGKARFVRGLQTIWHGVGELTGLTGHRYQEYRHAGKDVAADVGKISAPPCRDVAP
jgi:succinoglycan biosynthesis protein ExoM